MAVHVAMDLFSRRILAAMVDDGPDYQVAVAMFDEIFTDAGAAGYRVGTVHSDNGRTMKSKRVVALIDSHRTLRSHSRRMSVTTTRISTRCLRR